MSSPAQYYSCAMPNTTPTVSGTSWDAAVAGERRREKRISVGIRARMKSVDPVTSLGPSLTVEVVELSRGGLKIKTPRELLPGSLVQVIAGSRIMLGKVRHCTRIDEGFALGVELVKDF